jgi:hypothetical protein
MQPSTQTHGSVSIPRILTVVYRAEELLTVSVDALEEGRLRVSFRFPRYVRTNEPLDHVSAMQMCGALIEGFYAMVEHLAARNRLAANVNLEDLYRTAVKWIVRRQQIVHKHQVSQETITSLIFELLKSEERGGFILTTVSFQGFCNGEITCALKRSELDLRAPTPS